ncbi:YeeE/YedE family protein ASCRUDRAFT_68046 [Ascoidea rubescens DSM 1968]|uniref:YeeE/YedE family integral membrane protein n=1 Tax=Ascoidea rubescens DSM 1968 TaxID=1344418 RepID=A0A1D2VQW5_9ASCO|nr:hypothetical protein ASCRUDRAFT_68046 [Ascoidea rubescens DSM 1968]ODV64001.1 hypothetical protein ASCRUDRAFT_68046 [Ascoidea rubescens DSM 1968]
MFTPIESAIGALLIQFSTTNYYQQVGKTIGFSSLISGAIKSPSIEKNLSLLAGVLLSPVFVHYFLPDFIPVLNFSIPFPSLLNNTVNGYALFSSVGFLVGLGTSFGCGCTSGHMLAGLSRLRFRSFVATCVFASMAILTNTVFNLNYPCPGNCITPDSSNFENNSKTLLSLLAFSFISTYFILPKLAKSAKSASCSKKTDSKSDPNCNQLNPTCQKRLTIVNSLFSGFTFGLGLIISGMTNPAKVTGFLSILKINQGLFDPSLIMIILFTIIPNIFIWESIKKPQLNNEFDVANSNEIPIKFLIGNALFGIGWGILGICPGPGILGLVYNTKYALAWVANFFLGYSSAKLLA